MFLHLVLLIVFLVMGIFGLIFRVTEGVFVGAALVPWELRMILATKGKLNPGVIKVVLVISAIVGVGYFALQQQYGIGLILLGVQAYIYFVVSKTQTKLEKIKNQPDKRENCENK